MKYSEMYIFKQIWRLCRSLYLVSLTIVQNNKNRQGYQPMKTYISVSKVICPLKSVYVILVKLQWRIQRVHCRGGVTKSARSAAGGGCGRGYPLLQVGVRGPPPGNFLKKGCKWCILSPFFCRVRVYFFPQNVCNFCIHSSDLLYTHRRRIVTLAVEDHLKQKRGVFILSQ